ncbi:MAG: hypothetical protein Q8P18_21440 [Pseudomonadota bacterium]|nr:hypothetical protein [Pseudomonadota bacterium]
MKLRFRVPTALVVASFLVPGRADARTPDCPNGTKFWARQDITVPADVTVPVLFSPRMAGAHKLFFVSDASHEQPGTLQTCVRWSPDRAEEFCWTDEENRMLRPITPRWSEPLNMILYNEDEEFRLYVTSSVDTSYALVMCRDESGYEDHNP